MYMNCYIVHINSNVCNEKKLQEIAVPVDIVERHGRCSRTRPQRFFISRETKFCSSTNLQLFSS